MIVIYTMSAFLVQCKHEAEHRRSRLTVVIFCIHIFVSYLIWRLTLPQHLQSGNCLYDYCCTKPGVVGACALKTFRPVWCFLRAAQKGRFFIGKKMQLEPTSNSVLLSSCRKHSFFGTLILLIVPVFSDA